MRLARAVVWFGAALLGMSAGGAALAAPPELQLTRSASSAPVALTTVSRGDGAIILFWRTDCAPCLLELQHLAALRRASGSKPLVLVALQSQADLDEGLLRLGTPISTWRAVEDPRTVLLRFGGSPPRLPLAVALDRCGEICRAHHGLVGSNIVKKWIRACA